MSIFTETNYRQLLAAGLTPEHIDVSRLCTMCDTERFHSFRRDKEDGRPDGRRNRRYL